MRIWNQAKQMAAQTPDERNRYVDFLRAVSILAVIIGHWLIATAWYVDGTIVSGHLLKDAPQTQWLTWIFQVMPIFFIVGGYANAVSLESARKKGIDYAGWLATRLNRLVAPLLVLLIAWAVIAVIMQSLGARGVLIQWTSQAALIPTWFLAIYIVVVILAPLTYRFWRRWGYISLCVFAALAIATDLAFFAAGQQWLGWTNYIWVWLSVHQLGYAWRDGRIGAPAHLLAFAVLGFAALWLLVFKGPYPMAMVGSPDEGLSNTLPPKITLLALGAFQFGLLLAIETPMRRRLKSVRLWAATVLINSMIMTVYLWHITVMVVLIALLYLAGGIGLGVEPGTEAWWLTRPVWIAVLLLLLLPVALPLSVLERRGRSPDAKTPAPARQIGGALMICLGVALLAMYGYGGGPLPRLDLISFGLVVIGSGISGVLPGFRQAARYFG